ncbi:MAG: rhomboid family intramembrane serine protease [Actinomycetota bacterium]|nr:rhomboid family intramembrane serine protease [Actinomycetota bacterium]
MSTPGPPQTQSAAVCFRHPDRSTGLRCSRCGRSACPECLREAPVGFHCVQCLAQGNKDVRQAATVTGARPSQAPPVVTYGLIAVNVLVFLVTVAAAGSLMYNQTSSLFGEFVLWPYGVAEGGWWRVIGSGFLHYGPVHLLMNMLALYILGRDIETVLGRGRYLAVYAVSLLGGSASVMLFAGPSTGTAGASGAIFGLMGGLVVVLLRLKRSLAPAMTVIALNVVISFTVPGLSLVGHLGGLLFGALATAALVYAPRGRAVAVQVGALVTLSVVAVGVVAVRALVLRSQIGL